MHYEAYLKAERSITACTSTKLRCWECSIGMQDSIECNCYDCTFGILWQLLVHSKLCLDNSSFHPNSFFIHSTDWKLVEIRCCLMMCRELEVFMICGGWELASQQLRLRVETAIQTLSLRVSWWKSVDIIYFKIQFFGSPNIPVSQNAVRSALEALWT